MSRSRFKSFVQPFQIKTLLLFLLFLMLSSTPLFAYFSNWGAIRVETSPSGAQITIAGTHEYIGESPTPSFTFTMDHKMGSYGFMFGRWFDLLISKSGYQTQRRQVFVPFAFQSEDAAQRNPQTFMFVLQPMPQPYVYPYPYIYPTYNPYTTSRVEFTSDPVGASVFVDGQYYGKTPLVQNFNWMMGVHEQRTVIFEKSGYNSRELSLEPHQKRVHAVLHTRPMSPFRY